MSLLLSYEPENHLDAPLFGTVALSETYEEVVDAACDMWSNYLPPHNRVNGRHLAQQFKQPDGRVVWARISKSLFPSIVRNAPPDGFQLQLQIDKSLVGSYDSRPEFSSPTMLDTSLPALSSGSDSINSREHFPADESESATNNLTRSPITPMTPITPGPSFEDDPVIEAPPYPKGLDTFPYEAAGTNMHFKEGLEAFLAGRYNDACAQFQLAADQFHETNNTRQEADCLVRLGTTCRHLKNYVVARSHLLAARALYERLGSNCRQEMFQCARHLARIEEDTGNLRAALNEYRLLKTATEQAGLRTQYAWCSYYLGHIYNRMKRYEDALGSLKDAVNVSREIGNAEVEAFATEDCGYTAERQGHAGLALGCYQEALKLFKNQGQGKWLENEARVKRRIAQLRESLFELMTAELRDLTSKNLRQLFSNHTAQIPLPTSSLLLLQALIAHTPPLSNRPYLKLTDVKLLESFLVEFAAVWEHGTVVLDNKAGPALIANVVVDDAARKRKRAHKDDDIYQDDHSDEEPAPTQEVVKVPVPPMDALYTLLQSGTAKGRLLAEQFRSDGQFNPICEHVTKVECVKAQNNPNSKEPARPCDKVHFRPLIRPHTDPSLGHCSYLNTCYSEPTYALSPALTSSTSKSRPAQGVQLPSGLGAGGRGKEKAPCRYLHFEVDYDPPAGYSNVPGRVVTAPLQLPKPRLDLKVGLGPGGGASLLPPQWINCDVRRFDYSVLGKFHVIMADPPWDIHMSLPYGTMTDDEMRSMPIPQLQDEGLLFLWVTGRAMEVGRECMRVWGYTRVDEVVWLKTNQLQRVIRTGRTGHWLNHTKEHMLVGVKTVTDDKGNLVWPSWVNRGIDCDVIVSEVRETSRKPDEAYGIIERMCPGGRKIEIFGRKHNTRPGWLTLGNQLGRDQIIEKDLLERIRERYPERTTQ